MFLTSALTHPEPHVSWLKKARSTFLRPPQPPPALQLPGTEKPQVSPMWVMALGLTAKGWGWFLQLLSPPGINYRNTDLC